MDKSQSNNGKDLALKNAPLLSLMKRCGQNLGDILSGKLDSREIMFPGGDFSAVEKVYQDTPQSRYYNDIMAAVIKSLVNALPLDRELRILEVGAGTGGSSSAILSHLPAHQCSYFFTDISTLFLNRAKERFEHYKFIEYRTLDINKNTEKQGFSLHDFDLIVASNVLHAASDLKNSLRRLKSLLTSNGLLVLREITESSPVLGFEITFGGLLEPLSDLSFRNNHPFLDCAQWGELLQNEGFDRIQSFPDPSDIAFDEHIVVARLAALPEVAGAFRPRAVKRSDLIKSSYIHPLLGQRLNSPLETAQYQAIVGVDRQNYLAQHKVFDLVIAPGTAHFEIAAAAGLDFFACQEIAIENTILREALILSEGDRIVQVVLTPSDDTAEFQIFSQSSKEGAKGSWRLHVEGALKPVSGRIKEKTDLDELKKLYLEKVDVASYYQKFNDYGAVNYGPAFQGIRTLFRRQGGALAQVSLDNAVALSANLYNIHPALLDSCLQCIVAALITDQNQLTGDGYMPFSVDEVIFHSKAQQTVWCHAQMKEGDSFNQEMFSASFWLYDPEGRLIAEIINLNMKRTNRETLELLKGSQNNFNDVLYDTIWRQIEEPVKKESLGGSWLILADNNEETAIELVEELKSANRSAKIISFQNEDQNSDWPDEHVIDPKKPEDFIKLIENWRSTQANCAVVAYLYSLDSYETDLQSSRGLESFKRRVVGGFLHLTQALAKSSLKEVRLVILTRGAQNTRASEIIAPNQSVLWGLEKCVANELSELQPMIIDLDPVNDSSNDMALILSLIESSSFKEDKIALRGGKLLAPRLIQAQAPALSDKKYLSIPEGAEGFALDASKVGIENLCLKPLLRSEPRLGEIEIEVEAVGLNFKDVMIAMGLTAHRDGSIGTDCSGRVSKIGAQVTNFQVGDRVFATAYGAFASHVVTPATSAAKMPQDLSFTDAAAIPTVFMTAWYTLVDRGRVEKSSKVLLHSAAGGVGLAAIQVAKGAGAEIYATAGTARKRSLLKSLGVKKVYSSRSPKYADLLLKDTGGEGVDIVLNFLTGQAADAGLRALKSGGRFIEIGRTNVRTPEQIAAIRSDIEYCVIDLERMGYEESDKLIAIFRSVMDGFEKGVFKPIRKRVFSMENCIEAFRYMMEARHIGKVVVKRSFRPTSGSIRQDCFYLITGGLSELALALAEHLANKGAKKLILLARREAKDQEIEAISALKTKGVEIVTLKADLTNRESLETIWRERVLNLGAPLAGIYHLAGLLDDDLIINLNWERFDKVMAPKLDGAWFLHELTCDIDLDYFVMYSSMASIMGTHGQSNYAAANTFLDALAAYRRSDFLPAFSVNWGAWNSIGAVNRMGIMERIRRQGVEGFEPKTALAILDRLVAGRDSQRAVMKIDWNRMLPIISAGAGASFFSELKAKKPSIGAKAAIESSDSALAEKLRAMPMDKRVSALRQYLKKEIASFLHIDKDTIPDEAELVNLGMDSLVSLDLFQRIGKDLKIRIAPREIAANPNVAAMSEKFASDLGPDASQGPKETKAQSSVFSSLGDIFIADSEKAHEPFPLSDMQQAYWLGHNSSSMALSGVSCHFYFEAEAEGLDLDRYQRAWNVLINRHDMLRTVIMDGENQIVLKEFSPYQIKRHELSSLSPYDQKKRLLEIRHSLSHEIIKVDSWPNFRVEASIVGANLIRLHFSFDLIISDFHGISLMMKELEKVYAGNEESLAKLELTFRDYRLAEERYRLTQPFLDDKAYWLKRIETLPAAPKLPLALNPDNIIKPRFTRQRARLKAQTWQNLKDMSAKRNFTPTAVTLAAFAQTLARFSESPNFTLNLTLFNRLPVHSGVDSIVGEFTSNSLLEVDLSQSNNFESRAGQVWNQLWSDLEHRSFSGVRVLREMSRQRGLKASLMPVVFTSALTLDSSFTAFAMGGLGREIYSLSQTPQVWLDHQLFEIESELHLIIDSVEGLFPEGLLEDMFSSYAELLEDLASNEQSWISYKAVSLPQKQRAVRRMVNETDGFVPNYPMFEPFLKRSNISPNAPAVLCSQSVLTYSDLERQSRQVAAIVLENRTKSQPIVAIFMEKGVHEIVSVIGVQRAAGAYLPVDVNQPPLRISQILKQAGVNLVLGQSHLRDKFPSTANLKFIAVDELPNQDEKIPELNIDSKALAYVIYTSGSTGVPKGVMISHQAAMNTIIDVNRRFNLGPSDCLIGVSRLSFDLSVYDIFGILSAGGRLVLPQPQEALDPLSWLKLIHNHSATVWNSVPALASLLIQTMENENQSAPSLRLTLFSGDWIGLDLTPRLKKLMPNLRAIALGGATEASIWSNFHQIEALDSSWTSVPYGKPLTNQAFRVLDNQLNDRPDWVPGDLYILGQGLALGYLNDNEKTAERFIESPDSQVRMYKTGDRARYRPDGVLEFLGRLDNQIKIHGYRIELGEIEAVLKTHPAVKEACATLYRGQNDEKALALFVVPHKDRQAQLTVIEQGPAPITENLAEAFRINEKDYSDLDRDRFLKTWDDLTELYLASALDALKKLGLFDSSSEPKTFPINLKIIERYHKWTKRAIKALEERGFIEKNTDWRYQPVKQTKELECLIEKTLVQIKAMGFNKKVGILLEKTARELSSILTEERHTAEFYTDESVPDLYQKTLAVCNHLTAQIAVKAAQLSSAKPYRILEVGAGYGTVTRHILPHLEREKVVYDFTDHSQFFLVASQREFAAYDFVNYSIFNLDIAPYLQAFRPHSYDLIIAGNVLHDVKNIRFSLNSLKGLLKPSGLAIIMEQTIFQLPLELTEGLQRGFENFEDRDLRKDHPLLSKENWLALLIEQGFEKPIFPMPSQSLEAHLGLEVIVTSGPEKVTRFDPEILETYLAERLPRYMIPNRYQILDKLPLTENGKIDRNSLSHSLGPIESQLSKFAPPRTELEKRLAEIWVETLKLERVGRNDSFFLIGGDSLSAFQLLRKLQKEFGRQISLKDLLEAPTISEQSELISSEQSSADLSLVLLNETQGPIGICLAHPIEGLVTSYAKLSKAMPQIPFFALQSRGLEGQCQPIYDFSVMIENYSRLIEPINKAHKLILGGWSMGAFIAWEMANKAEERGEKINQTPLILLDPPSKDLWDKRYGQRRGDLIFLTEQLSKEAAQILAGQAEASQGFDKLSRKEQIKLLAESLKEAGAINSKLEAELENVDNMLKVGLANLEALYQYQPKKLKNRSVIYFKAKDQNQESLSYWRSLTGGSFEIVETRSDHFNLLQSQEDISIIALKLNEVLAKALTALKKED